ncbi:MAG: hypothetical protein OXI87_14275 [Albidovulum sp.]|nr:hypothetical protein [Albidovulum sp.]MDE0532610.1 hypothetical protein [Albidovulum sp.]
MLAVQMAAHGGDEVHREALRLHAGQTLELTREERTAELSD